MFFKSVVFLLFFMQLSAAINDEKENLVEIKVNLSDISLRPDGMYYILNDGSKVPIVALEFKEGAYVATSSKGIIEDIFGL